MNEITRLKVSAACWLDNYRATGRFSYLLHACAATRRALYLTRAA